MLQVTVTLTFDLLTPESIRIINGSWPTKTLIMVALSLMGFKLLSGQRSFAQGHCDLDLLKSIGIIYGSWQSMIPRKVYLGESNLKFMSGQDLANAGQTDRVTSRWTDVRT